MIENNTIQYIRVKIVYSVAYKNLLVTQIIINATASTQRETPMAAIRRTAEETEENKGWER